MADSLLSFDGLSGNLRPKRGKYQKKKSIKKYVRDSSKTTTPERLVHSILAKMGIVFETEFRIENKYYDVYIPTLNLLIEIDGKYWHGKDVEFTKKSRMQKRAYKNDLYKDGLATSRGYKLVRVWEGEITIDKIKELING